MPLCPWNMGLSDPSGLGQDLPWSRNDQCHVQAGALKAIMWFYLGSSTLTMRPACSRKGLRPPACIWDDIVSTLAEGHQGMGQGIFELVEPFHRELLGMGR